LRDFLSAICNQNTIPGVLHSISGEGLSGGEGLFLFRASDFELHEVIRAYDSKDQAHWKRKLLAAGIVDDGWTGQAVMTAAGLKLASGGGQNIFDPFALAAVGKGDGESVGRAEDVYRSVIKLAGFAADVSEDAEEGQPSCELAGDAVGDCEIEAGQRFLAVAHHQHPGERDG
jgi:hypothetical protein